MIKFPDELYDCTHFDDKLDKRVLNDDATDEQRRIFEEIYRDLDNGTLSDVEINSDL